MGQHLTFIQIFFLHTRSVWHHKHTGSCADWSTWTPAQHCGIWRFGVTDKCA